MRGAAQGGAGSSSSQAAALEQSLSSLSSAASEMPSNTMTTASGVGGGPSTGMGSNTPSSTRHQLADLLSEKVPSSAIGGGGGDSVNFSSDSEADGDFFDPFRSPSKMRRGHGSSQGSPSSGGQFAGPSGTKPAMCTVSPGVQSVPLASTLPLRQSGPNRESNSSSQQESSSSSASTPVPAEDSPMASQDRSTPPTRSSSATPVSRTESPNQVGSAPTDGGTSVNQTMSNPTTTAPAPLSTPNTNNRQQPLQQQPQSNYDMSSFFPGMVPTIPPETMNNSQQQGQQQSQQPPIANYQLPMPPGTMMPSGQFMPLGYPPMMFPGAVPAGADQFMPSQGQLPQQQQHHSMPGGQSLQVPSSIGQSSASSVPSGSEQAPGSNGQDASAAGQEWDAVQEQSLSEMLDQMEQEGAGETPVDDTNKSNLQPLEADLLTQKMRDATAAGSVADL